MLKQIIKKIYQTLADNRVGRRILTLAVLILSVTVISLTNLFDKRWYRLQRVSLGGRVDALPDLLHYLLVGRKRGYSPNPLFLPSYYDRVKWRSSRADPLLKYILPFTRSNNPTHPLFDSLQYSVSTGRMLSSPLANFFSSDRDIILPTVIAGDYRWSMVKKVLYEAQAERGEQERNRSQNQLSRKFDFKKQSKFINHWKSKEVPRANGSKPSVSIIMPAWNRASIIGEAIESVQRQTFDNWELIIADDGSTDDTVQVVRNYIKDDTRIRLIEMKHGGVCAARNAALNAASGDWIAFLDSDNTWTPYFLRSMIVAMHHTGTQAGYGSVEMQNEGHKLYRVKEIDNALLELGNFIDMNVLVVNKKVLDRVGHFDESLRRMVDYDLVLRIAKHISIKMFPILGVSYTNHNDIVRITNTERVTWSSVVKNKNLIDWKALEDTGSRSGVSIVLSVHNNLPAIERCLVSLINNTNLSDVNEILLIDNSSDPSTSSGIAALAMIHDKINFKRYPISSHVALGFNYGFSLATGSRVVFIRQDVDVEPGWLDTLLSAEIRYDVVAPVQMHNSRKLYSAGITFPDSQDRSFPVPLLNDHPVEDLRKLSDTYLVQTVSDGCLLLANMDIFVKLKGFDPIYSDELEMTDFGCRVRLLADGEVGVAKSSFVINHRSRVDITGPDYKFFVDRWQDKITANDTSLWLQAGFEIESLKPSDEKYGLPGTVIPIVQRTSHETLRWAIKSAHPYDGTRFEWGDMYFAEALRDALVSLGQDAVVDNRGNHRRTTSYLDDVIVSLRGLIKVDPVPGKRNILWVISHPELVTEEELKSFDIVYSAGTRWAQYASNIRGGDVKVLLQCTDGKRFHPPQRKDESYKDKVLFVGNSRNVYRKILRDTIDQGYEVDVYGSGWEGFIDKKYIKATHIPNHKLSVAYGSALVVLNDHWEDMRQWGFISNRIFDAGASGALVVSDNIIGADNLLPLGALVTYEHPEELKAVLDASIKRARDMKLRKSISRAILKDHTFTARARTMLEDVSSF